MRWLACLALLGCGEPLATTEYVGEPLLRLHLRADNLVGGPEQTARAPLRAAVFWAPGGVNQPELQGLVEDPRTARPVILGPPRTWALHDAPRAEHLAAGYAVGRILAYHDANQNRRHDAGEAFVGGVIPLGLLFADVALPADRSPTGRTLPAGLHPVMLPLACGDPPPGSSAPGTCGVPIGRPCADDRPCGFGTCVRTLGWYWPDGACAVPGDNPRQCRPEGAAWLPVTHDPAVPGYFVRACADDADCARRGPPYRCDVAAGACVPGDTLDLIVFEPMTAPPFCAADWAPDGSYASLAPAEPPPPMR